MAPPELTPPQPPHRAAAATSRACSRRTPPRRRISAPASTARLWRGWLITHTVLWALTLATAALVCAVPGGAPLARATLGLALSAAHNPPPTAGGVLAIAANNILHGCWPLALGPLHAQQRRTSRLAADTAVLANLLAAAAPVGAALAGYGTRLLAFLPHLPLEWAALALAAAAWVAERRRPLSRRERTLATTLTTGLLLCAALCECRLAPHR